MFSILSVILLAAVGFAVDLSRVHDEHQKIQIAADAASLAAVNTLGTQVDYSSVLSVIGMIARANAVSVGEFTEEPPQCGFWKSGAFVSQGATVCDGTSTAIQVTVKRRVPASFSRIVLKEDFHVMAQSVSYKPLASPGNCIRPFGVENSFLSNSKLQDGDTFTLGGTQEAGNWGKIDLDGNSSSGQQYTDLMTNNQCNDSFVKGNSVSQGTGNAQIWQVFDTLLSDAIPPYAARGMVVAVTSDFGSGNSMVNIIKFMKVDLLSQQGAGRNWSATFRVVNLDTDPESPTPPIRQLVR
jgi:hypothetical protein